MCNEACIFSAKADRESEKRAWILMLQNPISTGWTVNVCTCHCQKSSAWMRLINIREKERETERSGKNVLLGCAWFKEVARPEPFLINKPVTQNYLGDCTFFFVYCRVIASPVSIHSPRGIINKPKTDGCDWTKRWKCRRNATCI